ncbi:MAG: bifunctional aspartate kinase/homoserine dehydrogenase I, partial [Prosthecochloris sp.]|nr:bifunctional aspartate kinase/homoserine dehydrogenase I [Prosthecochloris sp.]
MNVLKFGGTSIENGKRIRNVLNIIRDAMHDGPVIVVVSAIRKVTDLLLDAALTACRGGGDYKEKLVDIERLHTALVEDLLTGEKAEDVQRYLCGVLSELGDVLHGVSLLRELSEKSSALIMSFGERFSAYIISSYLSQEGVAASYVDARGMIVTDTSHGDARVDMEASALQIRERLNNADSIPVV